jgi:nickel transport protein
VSPAARVAALATVALVAGPGPARAHEALHEIRAGSAIAVRAYFADGEPLAYRTYEVYSPADPKVPWQKGRTDRSGWLAFVPEVAGKWRVRVIDESGHGMDFDVDTAAAAGAPATGAGGTTAFVLRPLVGLAVIAAVFAGLALAYRRKGSRR